MKRSVFLVAFLVVLSFSIPISAQDCGVHCGAERWKVKSLTDGWIEYLDETEVPKTINWLRTRTRPSSLPNSHRLIGIETMTFRVRGVVLSFKKEDDQDFHVVIAQSNNHSRTIIIEFKDPQCTEVCSSEFKDQIVQARNDFIAKFGTPTTSFTELDDPVLIEVVGVGFFDRMHGQRGRALPSGIELHPIISFKVVE